MNRGTVCLIGAGPGDPDLLTVKAWRYLQQADVVLYDRLISNDLLELTPTGCQLVFVGKRKHLHAVSQAAIQTQLIEHARANKRVVRLKGGDPFIFGRGGEEVAALRAAGIPVEIVPGITAATGAAASASLPLTHRDSAQAVTMITAHKRNGRLALDWDLVMRPDQTVVFYMGFSLLPELIHELIRRGQPLSTQFSVVSRATQADERCVHATVGDICEHPDVAGLPTPALLIMHNTPAHIIPGSADVSAGEYRAVNGKALA